MSANLQSVFAKMGFAFGSDWAMLESQTFRFRDPLDKQRRLIPIRLDDTQPPESLAQFAYAEGRCLRVLEGHANRVRSVAWGADSSFAFSGWFHRASA
ncbi:MAG: hypothetical protein LW720_18005 [Pirellula sp.]|nr:hypothetical protein [Pirellula sp.]